LRLFCLARFILSTQQGILHGATCQFILIVALLAQFFSSTSALAVQLALKVGEAADIGAPFSALLAGEFSGDPAPLPGDVRLTFREGVVELSLGFAGPDATESGGLSTHTLQSPLEWLLGFLLEQPQALEPCLREIWFPSQAIP